MHVITALNHGGAEAMLAKLLVGSLHPHSAAAHSDPIRPALAHQVVSLIDPGVVGQQMAASGITVHSLGMLKGVPSIGGLRRLMNLARTLSPDIIQGWMYHGNLAAWAARRLACRQAVLGWNIRHSLQNPSLERPGSRFAISAGAHLSRGADFTIYNSQAAIAEHAAIGFRNRQAVLLPNGFDTELFRPDGAGRPARASLVAALGIDPQAVILGMIARVHPMKDHANLFSAVGAVRAAGRDVHLVLAGTGTDCLPQDLAAALSEHLPANRVSCLGDRRDVAKWLPGLDIAVLSSGWGEGFPNVLGEAMAAGLPCIATNVGDGREIVGDGGMCVSPGDPAELARAISALVDAGPDGRAAIGVRGRRQIERRYTLDRIVRQYEDLYLSTLMARPINRPVALPLETPSCAG